MSKNSDIEKFIELDDTEKEMLSELFKTFGEVNRLRLLTILSTGEISVNDLANRAQMSQSAVSHQLKILKQNRLVKSRREGNKVFYGLDDEHVRQILLMGMEHVLER